jgi:hypothetical protein
VPTDEPEYEKRSVERLVFFSDAVGAHSGWQSYGPMLGFGLSIPVFFATTYAWVLWIVMPILVARLDRLRRRRLAGR